MQSETFSLAITIFAVTWILSVFLGAGPRGLVRTIGTVLAAIVAFFAQIVAAVFTTAVVVVALWVLYRLLRWLLFGPQPRYRRRRRYDRRRDPYYDPYGDDDPYNHWL